MLLRKGSPLSSSEVTPRALYLGRREFLQTAAAATVGAASVSLPGAGLDAQAQSRVTPPGKLPRLQNVVLSPLSTSEAPTSYEYLTSYNNFYEFARYDAGPIDASALRTEPWKITVGGLAGKPGTFELGEFLKPHTLEERIYRHRCVEVWSAVIPWVGIPLADVIKRFEPASKAAFVEFTSIFDPNRLPGQRETVLTWPYVEALRMDEAVHPLAILAVGLYGEAMPKQDGAPIRLVVPWKYGFKSIKSIVRMRFLEKRPSTTWMIKDLRAYGFYSNVNPEVDHPGWSQATERRLGEFTRRKTLMFNGYADQVAGLYTGMDLRSNR
jgi:sulfoxide reductase catalytic subunit YedY